MNIRNRQALTRVIVAVTLLIALAGCSLPKTPEVRVSQAASPKTPAVVLTASIPEGATVPVDTVVSVQATQGTVTGVRLWATDPKAGTIVIPGTLAPDGTKWTANDLLDPGLAYTVEMSGLNVDGTPGTKTSKFKTETLSLKRQIYPSILNDGAVVGVAMPVVVMFDVPVTDKAAIEKRLSVNTTPEQKGSWHWYSNREIHWRPAVYWQPGTRVEVNVDINGVNAGNGTYGQLSKRGTFTIASRSLIMNADTTTHQLQVVVDGKVIRSLPMTAGKTGFETRSGTKVILEKFDKLRMDAATLGIEKDDPEFYDIPDVQWAMRETWSGEFIHSAPWSVDSQGRENVSHGCLGLSVANAGWLYSLVMIGDPVVVTGTNRPLEPGNGYTDWNATFEVYAKGSALA